MEQQSQLLIPVGYLVAIITGLTTAIGVLFWQLVKQNTSQRATLEEWKVESSQNASRMTQVVSENNHAMQMLSEAVKNNTKSTDKIFELFDKLK